MPCKCSVSVRDPNCPECRLSATKENELDLKPWTIQELYAILDGLLTGIGLLPLNQITTRPVLHRAVDNATEVLDRAVKEGRYVSKN